MVNVKRVAGMLAELTLMRYFPSDESARAALVRMVCEMIETEEQARWLVNRMLKLYAEWPGHLELRACFCSKFKPRDGQEQHSQVYPDGIPSERGYDPWKLPPGATKELPEGHLTTADKELDVLVQEAAKACAMPKAVRAPNRFSVLLKELTTAPQDRPQKPAPEPISDERRAEIQAQIDAIVAQRGGAQ